MNLLHSNKLNTTQTTLATIQQHAKSQQSSMWAIASNILKTTEQPCNNGIANTHNPSVTYERVSTTDFLFQNIIRSILLSSIFMLFELSFLAISCILKSDSFSNAEPVYCFIVVIYQFVLFVAVHCVGIMIPAFTVIFQI